MRKVDHELGAVRGKDVLAQQHGPSVDVGGGARASKHRRTHGNAQQSGVLGRCRVGSDGLRGALQRNVEQLVERRTLHIGPTEMLTQLGSTPHRDERERLPVGQIQSLHPQHVVGAENGLHAPSRLLECELQDATLRTDASIHQLRFDGRQTTEALTQRCGRHEPPETLTRVHQTLVAQHLERTTNGHAARGELRSEFTLRGQQLSGREGPGPHATTQLVGDRAVPDFPASRASHTCIILVS